MQGSNDDEADLRAVLEGRVQGMVRGSHVGKALVARHPEQLAMLEPWDILPSLRPTSVGEVFAFPTRKGSGLAEALTAYLARLEGRGELRRLLQKHDLV
jgi:ABC-type amino acid transport substrate-binding protein